jgi:hypothetical protein
VSFPVAESNKSEPKKTEDVPVLLFPKELLCKNWTKGKAGSLLSL